jgi:hypothetical protein
MIALLVVGVCLLGFTLGSMITLAVWARRAKDALKLRRYHDAIALCDDLVKTPDAVDLRPRALKILAAHRAATGLRE